MTTSCCNSLTRQFPLIIPAVKKSLSKVDYQLLHARIWKVVTVALCCIVAAFFFPSVALYLSLTSAGVLTLIPLDKWRAERNADFSAAVEVHTKEEPSKAALKRVHTSPRAALILFQKSPDNKNLWGSREDFEIFQILINAGDDVRPIFNLLLTKDKPEFLEFALKKRAIKPGDFSQNQMVSYWTIVPSETKANLLKTYGFNIDMRDSHGYTPLMNLAKKNPLASSDIESIKALVAAGANLKLTVEVKKRFGTAVSKQTAYDLCSDPTVKMLLKPH